VSAGEMHLQLSVKCDGQVFLSSERVAAKGLPNQWLERTAGQLGWPVPSALRAPAAAQPQRSASNGHVRVGD